MNTTISHRPRGGGRIATRPASQASLATLAVKYTRLYALWYCRPASPDPSSGGRSQCASSRSAASTPASPRCSMRSRSGAPRAASLFTPTITSQSLAAVPAADWMRRSRRSFSRWPRASRNASSVRSLPAFLSARARLSWWHYWVPVPRSQNQSCPPHALLRRVPAGVPHQAAVGV